MSEGNDNVRPLKIVTVDEGLARGEIVILKSDFRARVPMTIQGPVKGEPGMFTVIWHDSEDVLNECQLHVDQLLVLPSSPEED